MVFPKQEKVSAGTSSTILRSLQPDTVYTVSLVPVYAEGDGKTVSENGKTSELPAVAFNQRSGSLLTTGVVQGCWPA